MPKKTSEQTEKGQDKKPGAVELTEEDLKKAQGGFTAGYNKVNPK